MAHRFKRVNAKRAFGDGDVINVLHTVFRHTVHLGESRQKYQLAAAAGVQQCCQLRAHIAAQGGIRLFIKVGEPGAFCTLHKTFHCSVCLGSGQVARLGVHHQNVRILLGKLCVRAYHHAGSDTACRKLHAGIQRSGEIVRNYQQNHRMSSSFSHSVLPLCRILERLALKKRKKLVTICNMFEFLLNFLRKTFQMKTHSPCNLCFDLL